jgi:radical SAM protein with 4Fe4S-binding SPASM domain
LWSLIQQHEFFLLSILNDNDKLLQRGEFCGDVYTVEYLSLKPLTSQNWLQNFLPASMPVWKNRAKIVLSLLEFVEDIYQLDSLGSFYMCSLIEKSLGYSEDYEVKILDISNILPYEEIRARLQKKPCEHDQDCHIFEYCTSKCDMVSKLCTGELTHPTNLHLVCSVLRPYLLTSAPQLIERHLHELLSRCLALNSSMPGVLLEHAIVLSKLKSVLWREISY